MLLYGLLSVFTVAAVAAGLRQRAPAERDGDPSGDPTPETPTRRRGRTVNNRTVLLIAGGGVLAVFALRYLATKWTAPKEVEFQCEPLPPGQRLEMFRQEDAPKHVHEISGQDAMLQALFDQGLFLRFGFDDLEANRTFSMALEHDAECAMCWWGLAYTNSPNQNKVPGFVNPAYPVFTAADTGVVKGWAAKGLEISAREVAKNPSSALAKKEHAYLTAMHNRYPKPSEFSRARVKAGELRFAQEMVKLYVNDGKDVDALAMAAEALMNLSPWEYHIGHVSQPEVSWKGIWEDLLASSEGALTNQPDLYGVDVDAELPDFTSVQDRTVAATAMRRSARLAEALLLTVLKQEETHILALHLHVHITEASDPGTGRKGAERGELSADMLRRSYPRLGHLVHMPSHLYLRMGRFKDAAEANVDSWDLDLYQSSKCVSVYLPEHNNNLLVYGASMAGMMSTAEEYALAVRNMHQSFYPPYIAKGTDWVSLPFQWLRFARWEKLDNLPQPPPGSRGWSPEDGDRFSTVIWLVTRFFAAASKVSMPAAAGKGLQGRKLLEEAAAQNLAHARRAFEELQKAMEDGPKDTMTEPGAGVGIYSGGYGSLAKIALLEATAKMALIEGNVEEAVSSMTKAIDVSAALGYMEPPRESQPVRQCLGYVLLEAGKPQKAEEVYRRDLQEFPENPWSLLGLSQSLGAQGDEHKTDSDAVYKRYQDAWMGRLDGIELTSSCPMLSVSRAPF